MFNIKVPWKVKLTFT